MYPSDYANVIQALAEFMKEQGIWTLEVAVFARHFCKAAGIRVTLPVVEIVQAETATGQAVEQKNDSL